MPNDEQTKQAEPAPEAAKVAATTAPVEPEARPDAPALSPEDLEELKALRAEKAEAEKAKLSAKEREEREVETLRRDRMRLEIENEVMRAKLPEELAELIIPTGKQDAKQAVASFAKVFQKAVKAEAEKAKVGPAGAPVNPATGEPTDSSGGKQKPAANAGKPDRYFLLASGRKG